MGASVLDLKAMEQEAQRLLGTRFQHIGRDPATGLDCLGLVILVYRAGGWDFPDHAGLWQRERHEAVEWADVERLYDAALARVPAPAPGDMVLTSWYSARSDHVGILLTGGFVVHAVEQLGVIQSRLSLFTRRQGAIFLRPRLIGSSASPSSRTSSVPA